MPEFNNLNDAFQWWIDNVYPDLPSDDKRKLRFAKSDFVSRHSISDNRIQEILKKYGKLELKIFYEKN